MPLSKITTLGQEVWSSRLFHLPSIRSFLVMVHKTHQITAYLPNQRRNSSRTCSATRAYLICSNWVRTKPAARQMRLDLVCMTCTYRTCNCSCCLQRLHEVGVPWESERVDLFCMTCPTGQAAHAPLLRLQNWLPTWTAPSRDRTGPPPGQHPKETILIRHLDSSLRTQKWSPPRSWSTQNQVFRPKSRFRKYDFLAG